MYLINNFVKSNVIIFYDNFLITNFLKTILIEKISKNYVKKIITTFVKKTIIIENYFFSFLKKKIKFGYFVNDELTIFLPNHLLNTKKIFFPKKIFFFEILFKKFNIEDKIFVSRKFNFKKKKKNKIKINKNYLGIIKNVINYGIFIDIGQADGLLHISDIPFFKKIYDKFVTKNIISIKVIKFDKKLKKVSLNLKKNYKKNYEKFFYSNIIKCYPKSFINYKIICYNNLSKKYIFFNKNIKLKKKDTIILYFLKKTEKNIYLSFNYKLIKNNLKFQKLIIKHKFNNFFLFSYKKLKILYNKIIFNIKIKNIYFYKFFLFNLINNNFNKIVFVNNNYYLKNNNYYLKLKNKKNFFLNLSSFLIFKKKIFCFIRKY
ncbi:SSU ribosomal protein S1p [Candidatus Carsonella ruddii]|uniref:SSU ribosomal protein S1p n=1 Tax=Carsonella ruddii TaxID=114186 RepID=A0A1U9RRF7_CARRU|nr:SSU ribosomal protein S1p [Candidatus Carsonella ruddii]